MNKIWMSNLSPKTTTYLYLNDFSNMDKIYEYNFLLFDHICSKTKVEIASFIKGKLS